MKRKKEEEDAEGKENLQEIGSNYHEQREREREREKEIDDKKSILSEKNIQYELGGLRLVLNRFGSK